MGEKEMKFLKEFWINFMGIALSVIIILVLILPLLLVPKPYGEYLTIPYTILIGALGMTLTDRRYK
jgi:hypothetical protein